MTSGNAGRGLDRFRGLGRIIPGFGIWCSGGAPMSACWFGGGSCWLVLTSAFACRLVWIMVGALVLQGSAIGHRPLWSTMWILVSEVDVGRLVAVDLGWRG
ncbi:hypothetical protein [Micromonospora carbonacea]|uniref:Uncharacterized protein n=1 Tax=Micromonospora carbonacea TaxID=47853 RepID=A0A7H8XGE4_9ACTN|nr:hypothetical protein [Micromonospora carbonacea]MBB5829050.1 hypothetical protein [Micromonospora carbonacea]QLD23439.1 hypothetical protein HXZ27_03745 [Micromonospora carbonacea]